MALIEYEARMFGGKKVTVFATSWKEARRILYEQTNGAVVRFLHEKKKDKE